MAPRTKKTKEEVVAATPETAEATSLAVVEKPTKTRAKKAKTETKTEAAAKHEKAVPAETAHETKHDSKSSKSHVLQAEINIGMTGHVDHGKTSLTKALTGKWTDTHSEELKRGISIRLGYADALFYEYPGLEGVARFGSSKEKEGKQGKILRKVSFIDAPGHETLMTTMLSGAALMDGALLVIAANETCPQPRTAEHLMALKIGGIKNVIVVQNKVDLVTKENALKSYNEIKKFLADYGYASAPIIPVSANFNANVDAVIQTIQEHIPTPKGEVEKPFKMYISRSFDVNKPGTELEKMLGGVLGGSISQGTLVKGQKVELTPGIDGKPIHIEIASVRNADGELEKAFPRGLIAAGTKLDPGITSMDKFKGQILCAPGTLPAPTDKLAIDFFELDRLLGNKLPFPHVHELMVLTIGTNTIVGEVLNVKKGRIDLALKSKMTIEKGQKIAISRRETAAWRLAGYGIAL